MKKRFEVSVVIALSVLASACGGNKSEDQSAPDQAAVAPEATIAAAPAASVATASAPAATATDTIDGIQFASLTGDATKGAQIFTQCKTCHVLDAGQNRIGPSLHDIIGRTAGKVPGFAYSPSNTSSGIVWTPAKLFQYLEKPSRVVPGTKMTFIGLPKAQDRADVIAYLQTASK